MMTKHDEDYDANIFPEDPLFDMEAQRHPLLYKHFVSSPSPVATSDSSLSTILSSRFRGTEAKREG